MTNIYTQMHAFSLLLICLFQCYFHHVSYLHTFCVSLYLLYLASVNNKTVSTQHHTLCYLLIHCAMFFVVTKASMFCRGWQRVKSAWLSMGLNVMTEWKSSTRNGLALGILSIFPVWRHAIWAWHFLKILYIVLSSPLTQWITGPLDTLLFQLHC